MDIEKVNWQFAVMTKFKDCWLALAAKYNSDEVVILQLYDELVQHYMEPHRFYHTISHIESLLDLSASFASSLLAKNVVDFSIFYHDIIYRPGRGDNELQSAAVARKALRKLGVPSQVSEEVVLFIEATSAHRLVAVTNVEDLKYFLDFDLNILAADEEIYAVYAKALRKEFHSVPDALYSLGRTGFLKSMLSKPYIFFTDKFQKEKEAQARKNTQKEINDLARHI